MISSKLKGHLI
jgi:cysteine desulfurase